MQHVTYNFLTLKMEAICFSETFLRSPHYTASRPGRHHRENVHKRQRQISLHGSSAENVPLL
jgi:hypothetical protein